MGAKHIHCHLVPRWTWDNWSVPEHPKVHRRLAMNDHFMFDVPRVVVYLHGPEIMEEYPLQSYKSPSLRIKALIDFWIWPWDEMKVQNCRQSLNSPPTSRRSIARLHGFLQNHCWSGLPSGRERDLQDNEEVCVGESTTGWRNGAHQCRTCAVRRRWSKPSTFEICAAYISQCNALVFNNVVVESSTVKPCPTFAIFKKSQLIS